MKYNVLSLLKKGEKNSISRKQLVIQTKLSDRKIRNIIYELRMEGVPICSNSKNRGYYIAETEKEVDHFLNENHKRAMKLLVVNKKVGEGFGKTMYEGTLLDGMYGN